MAQDWVSDDDLPGRTFFGVSAKAIGAILEGAGFENIIIEQAPENPLWATAKRAHTLPDFVGPNMRLLICGLNPSIISAERGFGYARGSNRFWRAATAAELAHHLKNPWLTLTRDRLGMID